STTLSFTSQISMNWFPTSILMDDEHLILFLNPLFQTFPPTLQVEKFSFLSRHRLFYHPFIYN
ncbi:hypothetical protein, partial [Candidatus Sordicultor fermentans]|uniref:hypothetical protein n=1 Tax=Candidatus Sordicultor fermentans TaxID=1953203 RepID=UPI0039089E53